MKLPSKIRFIDEKLKKTFYNLENGDASEKELFNFLKQTMDNIEENAFSGIQISKRLIPKEYFQKYGVTNLWKHNLPKGWRLIYSIATEEIIVVSILLEWFNHKEYERRFKY